MHRYSTPLLAAGLVIASALSSCVDDKAFKYNQGDPVGFTTDVHNQSRSGLIHTTQNLDSFHVFAFCPDGTVFFHNLHVQKTDPEEITDNYYGLEWQIEGGPYYYPRDAAWVDYYVYRYISGIEGTYGTTPGPDGKLPQKLDVTAQRQMIHEFKPYDYIEEQEDLIIEHKRSYNNEVSGVELHFHHALTQVELKAYAPNNNVRVVVAGAWFCNIINQGDVYFPNCDPTKPGNAYGYADNPLFWILPDRLDNPDDLNVYDNWNNHRDDWKMPVIADAGKPVGGYRSHFGTFFNEPITLGFSPNEPIEGSEPEKRPENPVDPDDPIASEDNPLHDCTDYDGDGVCDHLVTDADIFHTTTVSHLLTRVSDDKFRGTENARPLNVMVPPQQLVAYNKNRDEKESTMFYDEDATPNNHGAYILLAIQIYNLHGTEKHMHRHLIFPYNGPEHWDVDGNLVNENGHIIDFLGNLLKWEGDKETGAFFPVDEHDQPIYKDGVRVDQFGHRVDPATGDVLGDDGKPLKDTYSYTYIADGTADPNFKWNKTFGWVCIPIGDLWQPGHKYTYVLEFMGKESGAGVYPPDDFDFTDLLWMDHSDDVRNGHFKLPDGAPEHYGDGRPWYTGTPAAAEDYIKNTLGYTILPSQEVRLRDPGTMNSKRRWVGKKQGDPVLSKPIDFRVVVDEWINDPDHTSNMEDYWGNSGKRPDTGK